MWHSGSCPAPYRSMSGDPVGAEHLLCGGVHWGTRQWKLVPPLQLGRCQWPKGELTIPPTRDETVQGSAPHFLRRDRWAPGAGELNLALLLLLGRELSAKK